MGAIKKLLEEEFEKNPNFNEGEDFDYQYAEWLKTQEPQTQPDSEIAPEPRDLFAEELPAWMHLMYS